MPVWHASVSLWTAGGRQVRRLDIRQRRALEQLATIVLVGVGTEWEFVYFNGAAGVYHSRVPVTDAEGEVVGPGMPEYDAGQTGTRRRRKPPVMVAPSPR